MKSKTRFVLSLFVLSLLTISNVKAVPTKEPAFHFVVTGGLKGVSDGSRAFFHSPLLQLKSTSKTGEQFVLTDVNIRGYRFRDTVFLSSGRVEKSDIFAAQTATVSKGTVKGFIGAQLFAIGASKNSLIPSDLTAEDLTRELGAIPVPVYWEIRRANNVEILAVSSSIGQGKIEWPKPEDDLDELLAMRGGFRSESGPEYLFLPRQIASTDRVFGVVDKLLKSESNAQYIDLGDTLFGPDVEDISMARRLQALMLKRNPAVLGAAWHDFRAFWIDPSLMKNGPYNASLKGKEILPSLRRVENAKGQALLFASLPTSSPELEELVLPEGTGVLPIGEALERISVAARKSSGTIIVGLSQDPQSATKAIESPVFDLVLSLVSAKGGALPSSDEIDLSQNHKDGLRSVSALVRVSSLDVTEVSGYTDEFGRLVKLDIKRHSVVEGGDVAEDASDLVESYESSTDVLAHGLPNRASVALRGSAYSEREFNAILGGLLMNLKPGTELAMIDRREAVTAIESEIPLRLTEALLNDRGRAVWLSIRGKYLKRILKAIKEQQFGVEVSVIGGTVKGPTIGQREISDAENYRIVVSESVFFEIDQFMSRESLFALRNLPSSGVQTALLEGGKDTLKILAEIRKRDSRDNTDIGETRALFSSSFPIADLIEPALTKGLSPLEVTSLIKHSEGRVQRTFVLDISDLDLGLKFNVVSPTLSEWQSEAANGGNPGFTDPRFFDGNFAQKLFYSKVSLKYIGEIVDAELGTNIKYFQPNSEDDTLLPENPSEKEIQAAIKKNRPAKDSLSVYSEVRFPFRRIFDEPPTGFWDLGTIARATYETQIWPNTWLTDLPDEFWPYRLNDLRLLLGLSAKPLGSDEVIRTGMLFNYDVSRGSAVQAFGYGYEVGGQGKWNVGFITLKLESSLRHLFPITSPDKSRIGLSWLVDAKVEVPIYGGFSLSLLTNSILGTRMAEPATPGYSVLFGFALSFSERYKWLL